MAKIPIVCRVCGVEFTASRWAAVTCTDTCRQRLRRGGEFVYLAALTPKEQRAARARHDAHDAWMVARRKAIAATRKVRDLKRANRLERAGRQARALERRAKARERQARAEHERAVAAAVGRAVSWSSSSASQEQGTLTSSAAAS